jgi:hypothetical protein
MKVGIIYSNKLKNYDFGPGHPFRGDRFESFMFYFNTTLSKSLQAIKILSFGIQKTTSKQWKERLLVRGFLTC